MIIFLYGPDSYRRGQKLNKIIEEYRKKHSGFSSGVFDMEKDGEFFKFQEFGSQRLMFDSKKLAVLKEPFLSGEKKDLKKFLESIADSKDFIVIITCKKIPIKEFDSILKKAFLTESFEEIKGDKRLFFIKKEAQRRGIELSRKAIDFLSDFFKGDSWGLISELDKLSFVGKKSFDVDDLNELGDYRQSHNIFGFINAVAKNWPLRQKILNLEKLFLSGEEPAKIFNILASLDYLPSRKIEKMADYDAMVKSGKIDYEEILLDLALSKE